MALLFPVTPPSCSEDMVPGLESPDSSQDLNGTVCTTAEARYKKGCFYFKGGLFLWYVPT